MLRHPNTRGTIPEYPKAGLYGGVRAESDFSQATVRTMRRYGQKTREKVSSRA